MRRSLIAGLLGCAVLASGAPARAADMALKAPPPPPCDWCGFYLGINVGADWGRSTVDPYFGVPFPAFATASVIVPAQLGTQPAATGHAVGIIGGGQAGYNWQVGHAVYGLEVDIDGTDLREKSASSLTRGPPALIIGPQIVTTSFSANVNWTASLRGRLGYAWDQFLLYATGGIVGAGTTLNTTYSIVAPPPGPGIPGPAPLPGSSSHLIGGWTLGVGGEWAITRLWSAGIEYRHSDFGTHGYTIGIADAALLPFFPLQTATAHFTTDQVTVRLNYHFH